MVRADPSVRRTVRVVLDITVVNVALPAIGESLGFAREALQWVVTAYVLFTGGLLLLGGRMADMFGRRRVFLAGLAIFTAASLASGLATSAGTLVVARAVQGLGAALLTPAALSIVTTTYSSAQRAAALSAWGAIGSAGAAAGMLLGGMLTTWLSWEWIFLVNVPVGIAAAVLALRLLPGDRPQRAGWRQLDVPGAVTVMAGVVLLVYALEGTAQHGWGSARTLALLAGAAALLVLFARVERSSARPLVAPRMWHARPLVAGSAVMLGATGILVGAFFLNSLYLQHELGASALEAGLGFLPIAVAIGLASHLASHLMHHTGSRALAVTGLALTAVAAALLAGVPDEATYAANLLPGFALLGLGVGLVFPAVSVTAMNDIDHAGAGLASGLMSTAHELGAAIGVAVLSAVAAAAAASAEGAPAGGFTAAFTAASVIAAVLAGVTLVALPAVRPTAGVRVAVH
jgi:EmrB/QacA subfamily drug resistance transporter